MQCSRQCMCWLNRISLRHMSFVHFHSKCLLLYWSCCSSFSLGQAEHSSWQTQSVLGSWWWLAFEPDWVLGHKHQLTLAGLNRSRCANTPQGSSEIVKVINLLFSCFKFRLRTPADSEPCRWADNKLIDGSNRCHKMLVRKTVFLPKFLYAVAVWRLTRVKRSISSHFPLLMMGQPSGS